MLLATWALWHHSCEMETHGLVFASVGPIIDIRLVTSINWTTFQATTLSKWGNDWQGSIDTASLLDSVCIVKPCCTSLGIDNRWAHSSWRSTTSHGFDGVSSLFPVLMMSSETGHSVDLNQCRFYTSFILANIWKCVDFGQNVQTFDKSWKGKNGSREAAVFGSIDKVCIWCSLSWPSLRS